MGRGNAVIDNFSQMPMPAGREVGRNLGTSWNLDRPSSATFSGGPLSNSPAWPVIDFPFGPAPPTLLEAIKSKGNVE
jgi:hypothetical protein